MTASTATAVRPVAVREQRVPRLRQASMRLRGMLAGRLAPRGLNVLFQARFRRKGLRVGVPIALPRAMGPTHAVMAVSSRTVTNNVG